MSVLIYTVAMHYITFFLGKQVVNSCLHQLGLSLTSNLMVMSQMSCLPTYTAHLYIIDMFNPAYDAQYVCPGRRLYKTEDTSHSNI